MIEDAAVRRRTMQAVGRRTTQPTKNINVSGR